MSFKRTNIHAAFRATSLSCISEISGAVDSDDTVTTAAHSTVSALAARSGLPSGLFRRAINTRTTSMKYASKAGP